jgi:prophage antirepressor-like protein
MTNQMQVFNNSEFGELGIVEIDGKPYFPARRCAEILGYRNPQEAIRNHCKGVSETLTMVQTGVKRDGCPALRETPIKIMPEGDLYRLIVRSKLPAAERFESWVFDEVLPAIRKHGAYMTAATIDKLLADPDFGIRLLVSVMAKRPLRIRVSMGMKSKSALPMMTVLNSQTATPMKY